jgi:protein required for attachment to host cells
MSDGVTVRHGCIILVADGRKALLLRNAGAALSPALVVEHAMEAPENPPDRDQGADAPGRIAKGEGRRAAVEVEPRRDRAEAAFAAAAAAALTSLAAASPPCDLILVAPPRTLNALRAAMPKRLRARVAGEVAKDLVKHSLPELTRALVGYPSGGD